MAFAAAAAGCADRLETNGVANAPPQSPRDRSPMSDLRPAPRARTRIVVRSISASPARTSGPDARKRAPAVSRPWRYNFPSLCGQRQITENDIDLLDPLRASLKGVGSPRMRFKTGSTSEPLFSHSDKRRLHQRALALVQRQFADLRQAPILRCGEGSLWTDQENACQRVAWSFSVTFDDEPHTMSPRSGRHLDFGTLHPKGVSSQERRRSRPPKRPSHAVRNDVIALVSASATCC